MYYLLFHFITKEAEVQIQKLVQDQIWKCVPLNTMFLYWKERDTEAVV